MAWSTPTFSVEFSPKKLDFSFRPGDVGYEIFHLKGCDEISNCQSFKEFFYKVNSGDMDSVDRFHNKYVKKIMDSAIARKKFINHFYDIFKDSACDIDALEKDFNVLFGVLVS